jgi:hypothetical protein
VRIEGEICGTIRATKAVVVGREGLVEGDIFTQDAVIGGRIRGSVVAESRLELQATCDIEGVVHAPRSAPSPGGRRALQRPGADAGCGRRARAPRGVGGKLHACGNVFHNGLNSTQAHTHERLARFPQQRTLVLHSRYPQIGENVRLFPPASS